jgi:pyruvate ferredoxin oxidoreductase alpha subunit
MSKRTKLLSAADSISWGVRLSGTKTVIDSDTGEISDDISDTVSKWIKQGTADIKYLRLCDNGMDAAISSEVSGNRTLLLTNNPKGLERASFMRLPLVTVVVPRPLPVFPPPGNNDTGALTFFVETNQEILDTIIRAFKISENKNVFLPSLIVVDEWLSTFREDVNVPSDKSVSKFLPQIKFKNKLDPKKPVVWGSPLSEGYLEFLSYQQRAMEESKKIIKRVNERWNKKYHRTYGMVETFHTEDAETVFVLTKGFDIAKKAVQALRDSGDKVGAIRIRVLRPWPQEELETLTKDVKNVIVIDHSTSIGFFPPLFTHIRTCYAGPITRFICGRRLSVQDYLEMAKNAEEGKEFWLF